MMDALNSMRYPAGTSGASASEMVPARSYTSAGGADAAIERAVARLAAELQASGGRTYNVYPRKSVIDRNDLRLIERQDAAYHRIGRPA
jgi:hypothetical protein